MSRKSEEGVIAAIAAGSLPLARAISHKGLDADRLFSHVGIDLKSMIDAGQHVQRQAITRLVNICARITDDPAFGLYISEFSHPLRYGLLSSALYSSHNLREYFQLLERYAKLIWSYSRLYLEEADDQARVVLALNKGVQSSPVQTDWWVAASLRDIQWVYGQAIVPTRIDMNRPEPKQVEKYQQAFGITPVFDMPNSAIYFNRSVLDKRLPGGNAQLLSQVERLLKDLVAENNKEDMAAMVRLQIMRMLPEESISIDVIARNLNVSTRTLYNRLKRSNTSFQQILDDTRADLSKNYLEQDRLQVKEVAYLLGYEDYSNFSRAFKRWTGMSPGEFRDSTRRN